MCDSELLPCGNKHFGPQAKEKVDGHKPSRILSLSDTPFSAINLNYSCKFNPQSGQLCPCFQNHDSWFFPYFENNIWGMAHLQHISKPFSSRLSASWRYRSTITSTTLFDFGFSYCSRNLRKGQFGHLVSFDKRWRNLETRSSTTSSSSSTSIESLAEEENVECGDRKGQFGHLVSENGWQVRRMIEKMDEMREVAHIQAQAFHQTSILFNDMFFQFFKAEVLGGLIYTLKNSAPDRYACLVAEPTIDTSKQAEQQLVGVVDVSVQRDYEVLMYLSEADEYLYISGIAVLQTFRRKRVATALLNACEMLAIRWGFDYLALRAYEDDTGARTLYTNAGYKMVSGDPPWNTTWIGRRRRVLMIKKSKRLPDNEKSA